MSPTYQMNKKHIYAWRLNNIDKHREINKKSIQKKRAWVCFQKVFLNILLN